MKNLNIFIAVLCVVLFGIGLIPAWSIDPHKLPPSAIIDKTKPGKLDTSPSGCVPTTCEQVGADRGNISDGCGKVLDCGIAKLVVATVDPPQYTGPYPKTLNFTGTITTKKKGKAYYQWSLAYQVDPMHHSCEQGGSIVFDTPGSKQVFFECVVPVNYPPNYRYMNFSAAGAAGIQVPFIVNYTKVLKPSDGNTFGPKQ